jgi:hypothetical protein
LIHFLSCIDTCALRFTYRAFGATASLLRSVIHISQKVRCFRVDPRRRVIMSSSSDENISLLYAFQSAHYLEISCFTLLVYDLLTTFGEEVRSISSLVDGPPDLNIFASQVEYFWSGPWSMSRVLFFLVSPLLSFLE